MFPVKETNIMYTLPGGKDIVSGHKFIVREDNNKILSCMTEDYKLVKNEEVLNAIEPVMKANGAICKEATTFSEGARMKVTYIMKDTRVKIDKGDYVNPEIVIRNSYDGSLEASAMAGAFRLICSNGLVIGYLLGKDGYRHIKGSGVNEEAMAELVEKLVLRTKDVFDEEFPIFIETNVIEEHIKKLIAMFPITAMDSLVQKMIGKPPKTYWDLLNAATWTTSHAMKRENEATHKLEEKLYPAIKGWAGEVAKA
tara:strand:- start:357 stop:1118 length:762 start_codon:yes stop_codon:yes gene_type:complete